MKQEQSQPDGVCSRCKKPIPNFVPPDSTGCTAGYYHINESWSRFANPGDVYVCDYCMWTDERYIAFFGKTDPDVLTMVAL